MISHGRLVQGDGCRVQKRLRCVSEIVIGVFHQGIEGVAQGTLADEFESSPAHPPQDVNLFRTAVYIGDHAIAELWSGPYG